jgi:hypothetical protein
VKRLRGSRAATKCADSIAISASLATYLRQEYNLNGRFKLFSELLRDFEVVSERFDEELISHYSEVSSFEARLSKPRVIKYNDREGETHALSSQAIRFSYKFIRVDKVVDE